MFSFSLPAQDLPSDLELEDPEDIQLLLEELPDEDPGLEPSESTAGAEKATAPSEDKEDLSDELSELGFDDTEIEEMESGMSNDELDSLEEDLGKVDFSLPSDEVEQLDEVEKLEQIESGKKPKVKIVEGDAKESKIIFDVGREERELLEVAKTMRGKIPNNEWNAIAGKSTSGTYKVMPGDWLWKISRNLFGTGFYYSKIWALNPYITNPHEIEPGMILSFSTGSDNQAPSIDVAKQREQKIKAKITKNKFEKFGDEAKPEWIDERERLKGEGVYFQYSTAETQKDLDEIGGESLTREYALYEPPKLDFEIAVPEAEYDDTGFDRNAKVQRNYKSGFYLTTFVTTNVVQDFGKIESAVDEKQFFSIFDRLYVRFDEQIDVVAGDKFSAYAAEGEVKQRNSDRAGFRYSIIGSFRTIQKQDDLWECEVLSVTGLMQRGSRITVYTPKIDQITTTYNSRIVEAVLLSTYSGSKLAPYGEVVYLDRGRADGLEVGNVLQVYGFRDRGTDQNITENPSYKNGELTILNVTDNFSTAIVSAARRDFKVGDIAVTKTKEEAARVTKLKNQLMGSEAKRLDSKAVDELDVELNLDDLNDSLLDKADKIQFTEDELAELERQEREKSIITENEKDLRSLERLETELESAEKMLNEARLDEDKLLEAENLNQVEKKFGVDQQESLDELEENFGKRYLDEDINDKENPYGLTEFDIEEIDELLNNPEAVEEQ